MNFEVGKTYDFNNWQGHHYRAKVLSTRKSALGNDLLMMQFEQFDHHAFSLKDEFPKESLDYFDPVLVCDQKWVIVYGSAPFYVGIDINGNTDCNALKILEKHGCQYLFDTELAATTIAGIRARATGHDISEYKVRLFDSPSVTNINSSCGTCQEAFPYDPLPANRPDGLTDCYRCRTLKGVFT